MELLVWRPYSRECFFLSNVWPRNVSSNTACEVIVLIRFFRIAVTKATGYTPCFNKKTTPVSFYISWENEDTCIKSSVNVAEYCKTPIFRCMLISRFSYIENLLDFNLADFYYQNSCRIIFYILQGILHITWQKCWYSMQINLWWWTIAKSRVYLISQFYSNRKKLMLAKYTCFTVNVHFTYVQTTKPVNKYFFWC